MMNHTSESVKRKLFGQLPSKLKLPAAAAAISLGMALAPASASAFTGIKITPAEDIEGLWVAWYPKGDFTNRQCAEKFTNLTAGVEITTSGCTPENVSNEKSFLHVWQPWDASGSARIDKIQIVGSNNSRTATEFWPGNQQDIIAYETPAPHRSISYDCFESADAYNGSEVRFDAVNVAVNTQITKGPSLSHTWEHGGGIYLFPNEYEGSTNKNRLTFCQGGMLNGTEMGVPYQSDGVSVVDAMYVAEEWSIGTGERDGLDYNTTGQGYQYIKSHDDAKTLSVATYNLGMIADLGRSSFWDWVGAGWDVLIADDCGGNDTTKARKFLKEMVQVIADQGPDVIALQEVWIDCPTLFGWPWDYDENIEAAITVLESAGYTVYHKEPSSDACPNNILGIGGCVLDHGLILATKHNIETKKFHYYENASNDEGYAAKGAMYMKLAKSDGVQTHYYHIFNTHLQSQYSEYTARTAQIDELNAFIDETVTDTYPVIIVGDMNIDEEENIHYDTDGVTVTLNEYDNMLSTLGAEEPGKAVFSNPYGSDCGRNYSLNNDPINCSFSNGRSQTKTLDHVLYRTYQEVGTVEPTTAVRAALIARAPETPTWWQSPGRDLSTHYPSWGMFCFKDAVHKCHNLLGTDYITPQQ